MRSYFDLNKAYDEMVASGATTELECKWWIAMRHALFYLKDATPKDRNGPCIRAIRTLEMALNIKDAEGRNGRLE